MAAKASMRSGYVARLVILGGMFLFFALYFLYDAMIGYPNKQFMQLEYQRYMETWPDDYSERWLPYAAEQGWPTDTPPGKPMSDMDIKTQYIYFVICMLIAFPFVIAAIRSRARWVAADEDGLRTSWGRQINWDQIQTLDRSRWNSKGIAVVHGSGEKDRITLDDWKYDTEPTRQIVKEIEQHLGLDAQTENVEATQNRDECIQPEISDASK